MDLFHGDDKICELHWDNRDKKRRNSFEVTGMDSDKYRIACSGWSPMAGPMGHVFIDVEAAKKAAFAIAEVDEEAAATESEGSGSPLSPGSSLASSPVSMSKK